MNKDELFKKISSVQDSIISIWDCKRVIEAQEDILNALSGLLDIKVEIESFYQYVKEGV